MLNHFTPATWPSELPKFGRFAATIVRNGDESLGDSTLRDLMDKCRVALIGMPDDTGVEMNRGRIGARDGPRAFRAALTKYGVAIPADETDAGPALVRVFDAGDVVPGVELHVTHDRVSEAVASVVRRGLLPVGIGGGHDLSFAFIRGVVMGLRERKQVGVLTGAYLDAHLDVRPEPGSGMPFRSLLEGGYVSAPLCIGANPLVNSREHMEYFISRGGRLVYQHAEVPDSVLPGADPAFVSLDMDVFDSAFAPGVSALNPCGLGPQAVSRLVHSAGVNPGVSCFDIMELNPLHDADGRTARLAAHMFLTFLRGVAERDRAADRP